MKKFSQKVTDELKHYVYALVDPRNNDIFYIGKGQGNRAFTHLSADANDNEVEKIKRINQIRAADQEPRIDILRHGLTHENALAIEATLIDAFGLEWLTNEVRGHGTQVGRQTAYDIERMLGGRDIDISEIGEPVMLFFINKSYSPTASEQQLYDATRQYWYQVALSTRTKNESTGSYPYSKALAIVDSIIIRAYTIECWLAGGSTFSSRGKRNYSQEAKKWEFVGTSIDDFPFLGRRITKNGEAIKANQNGYSYYPEPNSLNL